MKTAQQFNQQASCSVLIVGEPKSGKTRTLFAFPRPGIVDCDMNLQSAIRIVAKDKQWGYTQPAYDDNEKEIPIADRWVRLVAETKKILADDSYETCVIDGLGILCEWLMAHIVKENRKAGTNKSGKMELRDYGDLARMLRDYIMMLRLGRKYVVVTSHQAADKDELTGALRYTLAIPGQSKENLGGLFNDVWACTALRRGHDIVYEIHTRPTGMHVSLGTSFDLPHAINVTDKLPSEVWSILEPKIHIK